MHVSDTLLNLPTNLKQTNNTYSECQKWLFFSAFFDYLKISTYPGFFHFEDSFFNIIQTTRIYN